MAGELARSKEARHFSCELRVYSQVVREFLAHLGEKGSARKLETITELDIQSFIEAIRASGRSATTINKIRSALSSPFAKALKAGRIPFNPVAGTSAEKSDAVRKGTFSPEQIVALLKVAPADWQGAILFAYSTAARLATPPVSNGQAWTSPMAS